ncbi:DUF6174 domain-containing protein [Nocardioides sp.]|uniref:DUF6174 domain-containing protein n=1 Tax=Nocardioides sp. TaxID=35761 RepID=UPI0035161572
MPTPRPDRARSSLARRLPLAAATLACLAALAGLAGCGSGDTDRAARDTAGTAGDTTEDTPSAPSSTGGGSPTGAPTSVAPGATYPAFAPRDYDYVLGLQCYCPVLGSVSIRVRDGEVAAARLVDLPDTGQSIDPDVVPEVARLTIQDVIDRANEQAAKGTPKDGRVTVAWPDSSVAPTSVSIDPVRYATDDEITYTISKVVVR